MAIVEAAKTFSLDRLSIKRRSVLPKIVAVRPNSWAFLGLTRPATLRAKLSKGVKTNCAPKLTRLEPLEPAVKE